MRKKVSYSYYNYRRRRGLSKRLSIIAIILGIIISVYLVKLYDEDLSGAEFVVSDEHKGDFVQNMISYSTYKQIPQVKGIYIPAYKTSNIDELISIANTTEINSFVIDVKDDNGHLTFDSNNPVLLEAGCVRNNPYISDINSLMKILYLNNVYPIARIVVFKDKIASTKHPERMVQDYNGQVYATSQGEQWLNPYDISNWDYILEVCKEAINVGFKEIQFDYIRFHESMNASRVDLPTDVSKTEIISQFVDFMMEELKPYGVVVSADVFGTIITSSVDANIVGQDYKELVKRLDVVCPMIYPSHYGTGSFGQTYPDLAPYEIILAALQASNEVIRQIPISQRKAIIRPWLQDFTATWVEPHQVYSELQVRQQIKAVYDAILSEWIMWNGAANYTKSAFTPN
ncbi:MAG: hypothetical protein ATN34_05295 [Epulopiscium sp. Nele67-Bin002]|nr:MAG: hypothetical protein ATN34_05295 [Epulopiscium sp. Nele67-Bin002]